ncbi:hypothetical protein DMX78_05645 [Cutibacterium acnes]|nr:hypothetical protein FD504_08295 [Cutibacterium acnes]TNH59982.1 hypothetical protein DMX78_05645 [Cutibacterium acnes]
MGDKDIRLPRSETEFTFAAVSLLRALETGLVRTAHDLTPNMHCGMTRTPSPMPISTGKRYPLSPPMDLSSLSS